MDNTDTFARATAERIRARLREKEWTILELCKQSGVSRPSMQRCLAGKGLLHAYAMVRVAKALDVSMDWLCGLDDFLPDGLPDLARSFRAANRCRTSARIAWTRSIVSMSRSFRIWSHSAARSHIDLARNREARSISRTAGDSGMCGFCVMSPPLRRFIGRLVKHNNRYSATLNVTA